MIDDANKSIKVENVQENNIEENVIRSKQKKLSNSNSTVVVKFDCNGGVYQKTLKSFEQVVESGSLLIEPDKTKMTKEFAFFDSWITKDGRKWNFEEDIVTEETSLIALWEIDYSEKIETFNTINEYFLTKYYKSTDWHLTEKKSMKDVSGNIPIEVRDDDNDGKHDEIDKLYFPKSDIDAAIEASGIASTYGGCGPIAMIGIMDYFARYRNYTSIMANPLNSNDRVNLAYDIFTYTKTYEIGFSLSEEPNENVNSNLSNINNDIELLSGGAKDTLTLPDDYVESFNLLMLEKYHLDQQIVAHNQGFGFISKKRKIDRIKQSIDEGLPVTIYAAQAGFGTFADHYVNAYEYEVWEGQDMFGNKISNTIFNTRTNWGEDEGQDYNCHMDADMLETMFTGVIYYTVKDKNQIIRPIDFAKDFVNDNGQGQYFYYEKTADITTADGFTFGTARLRCGYIENQYVVLSSKRKDVTEAYLTLNFDIAVKAINFDISQWGTVEGFANNNCSITLEIPDETGEYVPEMSFLPFGMSTDKDAPDNYYLEFSHPTNSFKFRVKYNDPSGDRNKGRIVIGDMNLFY